MNKWAKRESTVNFTSRETKSDIWQFIAIALSVAVVLVLFAALIFCCMRPRPNENKIIILKKPKQLQSPSKEGNKKTEISSTDEERDMTAMNLSGLENKSPRKFPNLTSTSSDLPILKHQMYQEYQEKRTPKKEKT